MDGVNDGHFKIKRGQGISQAIADEIGLTKEQCKKIDWESIFKIIETLKNSSDNKADWRGDTNIFGNPADNYVVDTGDSFEFSKNNWNKICNIVKESLDSKNIDTSNFKPVNEEPDGRIVQKDSSQKKIPPKTTTIQPGNNKIIKKQDSQDTNSQKQNNIAPADSSQKQSPQNTPIKKTNAKKIPSGKIKVKRRSDGSIRKTKEYNSDGSVKVTKYNNDGTLEKARIKLSAKDIGKIAWKSTKNFIKGMFCDEKGFSWKRTSTTVGIVAGLAFAAPVAAALGATAAVVSGIATAATVVGTCLAAVMAVDGGIKVAKGINKYADAQTKQEAEAAMEKITYGGVEVLSAIPLKKLPGLFSKRAKLKVEKNTQRVKDNTDKKPPSEQKQQGQVQQQTPAEQPKPQQKAELQKSAEQPDPVNQRRPQPQPKAEQKMVEQPQISESVIQPEVKTNSPKSETVSTKTQAKQAQTVQPNSAKSTNSAGSVQPVSAARPTEAPKPQAGVPKPKAEQPQALHFNYVETIDETNIDFVYTLEGFSGGFNKKTKIANGKGTSDFNAWDTRMYFDYGKGAEIVKQNGYIVHYNQRENVTEIVINFIHPKMKNGNLNFAGLSSKGYRGGDNFSICIQGRVSEAKAKMFVEKLKTENLSNVRGGVHPYISERDLNTVIRTFNSIREPSASVTANAPKPAAQSSTAANTAQPAAPQPPAPRPAEPPTAQSGHNQVVIEPCGINPNQFTEAQIKAEAIRLKSQRPECKKMKNEELNELAKLELIKKEVKNKVFNTIDGNTQSRAFVAESIKLNKTNITRDDIYVSSSSNPDGFLSNYRIKGNNAKNLSVPDVRSGKVGECYAYDLTVTPDNPQTLFVIPGIHNRGGAICVTIKGQYSKNQLESFIMKFRKMHDPYKEPNQAEPYKQYMNDFVEMFVKTFNDNINEL